VLWGTTLRVRKRAVEYRGGRSVILCREMIITADGPDEKTPAENKKHNDDEKYPQEKERCQKNQRSPLRV